MIQLCMSRYRRLLSLLRPSKGADFHIFSDTGPLDTMYKNLRKPNFLTFWKSEHGTGWNIWVNQSDSASSQKRVVVFFCSADSYPSVLYLVALFCLCLVPLWVVIASKHPDTQTLLHTGWLPIVIALVISRYRPHSYGLWWLWKKQNKTLPQMIIMHTIFIIMTTYPLHDHNNL